MRGVILYSDEFRFQTDFNLSDDRVSSKLRVTEKLCLTDLSHLQFTYISISIYLYIYLSIYTYVYIYIYNAWTLKNDNIDYSISWRVLSSNSPYNSSSKRCNLCLKEKFLIIYRPDLSSLNKRNELVSSCRHRNKALLRNS